MSVEFGVGSKTAATRKGSSWGAMQQGIVSKVVGKGYSKKLSRKRRV
jgi:hypothetical protein